MPEAKSYRIKEAFYTLQGEGAQQGRPAVFCRFSKCNLWNGREADRETAVCNFCDTDFVGTDGQNGGVFANAEQLARHLSELWPVADAIQKFVVCTGGEPLLQLDTELVEALHQKGFEVAVETNGTLPVPDGIDWLCVSPKGSASVVVTQCDELKLVFPQDNARPEQFDHMVAQHYFLSPKASPHMPPGTDLMKETHTRQALSYCLQHPKWRLSMQMHKILGID